MTRAVNTALAGSGGVLQVVQTVKTDTFSTTNNTWTDITGYSVSITPTSTASRILVSWQFEVGSGGTSPDVMIRLVRDSTVIATGASNGGTDFITAYMGNEGGTYREYIAPQQAGEFLDSPATTSATTYKLQIRNWSATTGISVGRRWINSSFQAPSFLTVMEIAG